MLVLVTLVALTVGTPVTMGLVVAALSLALRVADFYLAETRPELTRAALVAIGHLLLSLAFGIVAGGLLNLTGLLSAAHAESLAAGAFTLGLYVLPGAGAARRTASRVLARVLPGSSAIVVSTAIMGPIALIATIVALADVR
ncbi:hypothetical protein FAF44_52565 [Nonomuraea sp. MG754425]|uniref:hypothetical protein n=1 Tax=Nonomuraea sp. MG754425 TaxID=2570319 RepID=UPI001F3C69D6|nr:hypothetical protein [Nonomuraea sp. MG754425]MCF6476892.1 hypothetical protein [Nonomuraea sp. MG754425]